MTMEETQCRVHKISEEDLCHYMTLDEMHERLTAHIKARYSIK